MSRYYNDDELYHYGVKHKSGRYPYGSGERPFQDVGGPTTGVAAGFTGTATHPMIAANAAGAAAKYFEPTIGTGKGKANVSAAERSLNETKKGIDSINSTARQIHDTSPKRRPSQNQIKEVKSMSDEELRQVINRKNLERQYYEATKDPATNDGYNKIMNVLAVVGTVTSIAAGVATIYSSVRLAQQKQGGGDD